MEFDFEALGRCRRINVVGTSGSGKTTFARELAGILDLPYVEMDALFWKPNWVQSSRDEMYEKVRVATDEEAWVLDGNYTRTIPAKWRTVELVVWIDLGFLRTTYRVLMRALNRSFSQQELWPGTGNRESLATTFLSRKSVVWWSMTTHGPNRRKYGQLMEDSDYSHIPFVRLDSPGKVGRFLQGMQRTAEARRVAVD